MRESVKAITLGFTALFLCSFTYILGALPLMIIRNRFGRPMFFAISGSLALGLWLSTHHLLAGAFLTLIMLVAIYAELEERAISFSTAGLISVLTVGGLTALGVSLYVSLNKVNLVELVNNKGKEVVDSVLQVNPKMHLELGSIIAQTPSGVLMGFIFALALAITLDRSIFAGRERHNFHSLLNFELPDACIWLALFAIGGAQIHHNSELLKIVALNLLNVMICLYFLQGLAVMFSFFKTFRFGPVWQVLWLFVFVFQLFLFVAIIGFIDYWLDIRKRIYKKVAPTKLDKRV